MASAIIGGMNRKNWSRICVSEISTEARKTLKSRFPDIEIVETCNSTLVKDFDVIVFAVKPQAFDDVKSLLLGADLSRKLLLSIMAGIPLAKIQQCVSGSAQGVEFVRVMPNMPALIGKGVTGAVVQSERAKRVVEDLFSACSKVFYFKEEKFIDVVTAISGSGPAYFYYFIECLRNAGIGLGLSSEEATAMAIGTALGASLVAESSQYDIAALREQVTSKKGTTEAALNHMKSQNFEKIVTEAAFSAFERSQQLAKL